MYTCIYLYTYKYRESKARDIYVPEKEKKVPLASDHSSIEGNDKWLSGEGVVAKSNNKKGGGIYMYVNMYMYLQIFYQG